MDMPTLYTRHLFRQRAFTNIHAEYLMLVFATWTMDNSDNLSF